MIEKKWIYCLAYDFYKTKIMIEIGTIILLFSI